MYAEYSGAKLKNNLLKGEYKRNALLFLTFNVSSKFLMVDAIKISYIRIISLFRFRDEIFKIAEL